MNTAESRPELVDAVRACQRALHEWPEQAADLLVMAVIVENPDRDPAALRTEALRRLRGAVLDHELVVADAIEELR